MGIKGTEPEVEMKTLKSCPEWPFPESPMFIMNVDQAPSFPSNEPLGGKTYGSGIVVASARLIKDMARDVAWRAGRGIREAPCKKDVGMYGTSQYFTSQWRKFSDKRLAHERVHKKDNRGQDNRVKISQASGAHP